jgi:HD-GYP domain-containing protein (c-di-GMP phosphodiesterase class II)
MQILTTILDELFFARVNRKVTDKMLKDQMFLLKMMMMIFSVVAFIMAPLYLNYFSETNAHIMGQMISVFFIFNLLLLSLFHYEYISYKSTYMATFFGVLSILTATLFLNTDFTARILWFALPIFMTVFIGGKRIGQILTFFSFSLIGSYFYLVPDSGMSLHDKVESFAILITFVTLIAIYEFNNERAAVEIQELNEQLSLKVYSQNAELEETQREMIYRLGELGETRSKETGNHVKRVAKYSYILAQKCALSEDDCNLIFLASPMHDIGKVAIPDAVLNKPGKLSIDEWEVMKTHSEIGYSLFNSSKRPILKASAIISNTHHEKYDGSGYPNGLKGEAIPIMGRITAIADVFDALGSERCYKKAWPLEEVLNFFKQERGKHFDPELIDLFFEHLDEFLQVRNKYSD